MISIIIPIYNSQKTLLRAVESVINQKNVSEIILIDDGSTDKSNDIAIELVNKFDYIKFFPSIIGNKKGAAAARNLGLEHAKSEWIQFLDADDELLEGKIDKQITIIKEGMSFIVGNAIDCFEDGHQHLRKFIQDPWAGLIAGKLGITSANLWNRQAVNEIGGWNESLSSSQEYDLMFRLLKENTKMGFCNYALTKIHKTRGSISNNPNNQVNRTHNWLKIRKDVKAYLINRRMFSLERKYVYSGYVFEFCKRNNCLSQYDGSIFLYKIFQFEKTLKTKLKQVFSNIMLFFLKINRKKCNQLQNKN